MNSCGDGCCVLLSTYNGEKYLQQQIKSIFLQNISNIKLIIRDDGSNDCTIDIIKMCQEKYGNIEYYKGDNIGSNESFWFLIKHAPNNYGYYALADQDDVWDIDKLSCAISKIKNKSCSGVLYHSNLRVVDENLNFCRNIHRVARNQKSKYSALAEAIATGCTMVFDNKLLSILQKGNPRGVSCHDTWIYLVAKFMGECIYDFTPHISYRQHSNNVIGTYKSLNFRNLFQLFINRINAPYGLRTQNARELLRCHKNDLSDEDKKILKIFINYNHNFTSKIKLLLTESIHATSIFREFIYLM